MDVLPHNNPDWGLIGNTRISVFPNTVSTCRKGLSPEERSQEYDKNVNFVSVMTLREFLLLGFKFLKIIKEIRECTNEDRVKQLKRTKLPAGTISARLNTRDGSVPLEKKMEEYTGLLVVDLDHVENPEEVKQMLSHIPYIWYAGLSVSGKGVFAIAYLANEDHTKHLAYFKAVEKDMKMRGLTMDPATKDVTRLRILSYDDHPYINPECSPFVLEVEDCNCTEDKSEEESTEESPRLNEKEEIVEKYVEEWEKKKIALEDYNDWIAFGMSLSSLGDVGLGFFKRISRFSRKYREEDTEKTFRNLQNTTQRIGLGTFFFKCQQYRVIPDCIPYYETIPFPVEVFPEKVQEIIRETGSHNNFPPGYIAPSLLFVACMACGNAAIVEIMNGWTEKPLLYLGIVGSRGTNKSSSLEFALDPIKIRENKEYDKFVSAKEKYEQALLKAGKEKKTIPQPPAFKQYILDDFTPESIVKTHQGNPRGLIVFQDELMGFISSFNKYRSGSDEQMWTQLFAGGGVMVNRVSSDPVRINDTCIGVFGGIQPQMLKEFARGKVQNGFMDRWLLSYPEKVKYPKFNDKDISSHIKKGWKQIIERILDLPYDGESRVIKLTRDAKKLYKEWFDHIADQKNNGSLAFAGMATKMERYCNRLALGLEIVKYGCQEGELKEIGVDSMKGAIALCYYFIACGLKAQKQFLSTPAQEFTTIQQLVYDELPKSFGTAKGLEIALSFGMSERTFKRWLNTSVFRKIDYGFYEKKF